LAVTAQLPQSAHFSLGLPYTIFGLGRTPKFVDTLTVGIAGRSKPWTQIIPNSQMVVIPSPLDKPSKWHAQLFITPSKMILMSGVALTGTCGLIIAIIGALYWKEKREDRIEKLQEAHRFHFDAM
jgi:integrin alpha FG-GAP repeat containing protein 1